MKFYWNSTTVDVYFERYTLTDGSLDAVRNGNSQYSTWANSTSITGMSIPTSMTTSGANNGVDDNRTAITATKPALNLTTNPAYGSSTSASGGWTASISTAANPSGGTYSVVSQTAGNASVNSSSGALTASGLSAGASSTVTVRYSLSGYNSVDITASGSASSAAPPATPSAPTVEYKGARNGRSYTWDVSFTFASGVTSMDVMNQYWSSSSGTYTSSPNDTDPANYNISNTYDGYIEFRNFASGTAMPLTDANGYWDNTYNWMRARIRARNASGSSSWSAWSSWA